MAEAPQIEFIQTVNTTIGMAFLLNGSLIEVSSPLPLEEQDAVVIALARAARISFTPKPTRAGFSSIGGVAQGTAMAKED